MIANPGFWEGQFRAFESKVQRISVRLYALLIDGNWQIKVDPPIDPGLNRELKAGFCTLAERAAVADGMSIECDPGGDPESAKNVSAANEMLELDWNRRASTWLNRLRKEGHFKYYDAGVTGIIQDVVRASIAHYTGFELCPETLPPDEPQSLSALTGLMVNPPLSSTTYTSSCIADELVVSPFRAATVVSPEVSEALSAVTNESAPEISSGIGELIPLQAASASLGAAQLALNTSDWELIASAFKDVEDAMERVLPFTPRDANERDELLLRFTCDPKGLGLSGGQFVGITSDEWLEHFREWERARRPDNRPKPKGGRPTKDLTRNIRAEWVKMGSPTVTAKVCDKIGRIVFTKEAEVVKSGSKKHKRIRERVRQAIRRSTPSQHN
jgi:hypothetical protein